jgi:DNA-binding NtrC family response regulator
MSLKVYYLDDEADLCELFADYFSSDKVAVTTFVDTKIAIEAIKKNPPDIFFVDYRLPNTTGDEVAKALDPKIPKILVTGEFSIKTDYKFDLILSKPIDVALIAQVISKNISANRAA